MFGRMSARIPCSGTTSADRLMDLRNARREKDKRDDTFSSLDHATIRRYFYSERLPAFASLSRGPDQCKSSVSSRQVSEFCQRYCSSCSLGKRSDRIWSAPAALAPGNSFLPWARVLGGFETIVGTWKPRGTPAD